MLVFVTSASRPEYTRDFLTCLAVGNGDRAAFSYRTRWIQPSVLARGEHVAGADAVIVYCHHPEPPAPYYFLPLRHAKVHAVRPPEIVRDRSYTADTHIAYEFELQRYVNAEPLSFESHLRDRWDSWVQSYADAPRRAEADPHYLFELDGFEDGAQSSADGSWQTIASQLVALLPSIYVFRVEALLDRRKLAPRGSDSLGNLEYRVRTKRQYTLQLSALSRSGEAAFGDAIQTRTGSQLIAADNPKTQTTGPLTKAAIDVTTGPVQTATRSTMVVQGAGPWVNLAPRVEITLNVRPNWRAVVFAVALIGAGSFFAGISTDLIHVPTGWLWAIKVAGAMAVAAGVFIAARSAPGVSTG